MSEESTSTESTETSSESSAPADTSTETTTVDTGSESTVTETEQGTPEVKAEEQSTETPSEPSTPDDTVNNLLESFMDNDGTLTEEESQMLKDTGISEELFVSLANAQAAQIEANDNRVYDSVGGKDNYDGMITFAQENLTDSQLDAYDAALFSGNPDIANFAVMGLKAMMEASNTEPSNRIDGVSGDTNLSNNAFSSQQEVIDAMRDNRYGMDGEYTKLVDAKRLKSAW